MGADLRSTSIHRADGTTEVALAGEVDLSNASDLRDALAAAADASSGRVVDVIDLRYLDSAGVGVLYDFARGDRLELVVGPGCLVATLVKVCGLAEAVPIHSRSPAEPDYLARRGPRSTCSPTSWHVGA
jgi:anti-anti-sigma factor